MKAAQRPATASTTAAVIQSAENVTAVQDGLEKRARRNVILGSLVKTAHSNASANSQRHSHVTQRMANASAKPNTGEVKPLNMLALDVKAHVRWAFMVPSVIISATAKTIRHATLRRENVSVNVAGWDGRAMRNAQMAITAKTAKKDVQRICHRRQRATT